MNMRTLRVSERQGRGLALPVLCSPLPRVATSVFLFTDICFLFPLDFDFVEELNFLQRKVSFSYDMTSSPNARQKCELVPPKLLFSIDESLLTLLETA